MKELNEIKYKFVIDTTKFFVGKYIDGESFGDYAGQDVALSNDGQVVAVSST